eukprot:gb/GECG01007088.1/.p1 GENE.gb/GECG01007088.1/~~gb/GECG01007088.1/.p1  ORF type:complete len:854 (+),score=140.74 gb/GECG01007088.1/:1-2562(+)
MGKNRKRAASGKASGPTAANGAHGAGAEEKDQSNPISREVQARVYLMCQVEGKNDLKQLVFGLYKHPELSQVLASEANKAAEEESSEEEEEDSGSSDGEGQQNGSHTADDSGDKEEQNDEGEDSDDDDDVAIEGYESSQALHSKLVENFRALCTGECLRGAYGKKLSYKESKLHAIYKSKEDGAGHGIACVGGDFIKGNGEGGESIDGKSILCTLQTRPEDIVGHSSPLIAMKLGGDRSVGSQFIIINDASRMTSLPFRFVVIGELEQGVEKLQDILKKGSSDGTPRKLVTIKECGDMATKSDGSVTTGGNEQSENSSHSAETSTKRRKVETSEGNVSGKDKFSNSEFFSEKTFTELPLSEPTMKAIKDMGFERMTKIQAQSIPALLEGTDLLGAAKTGSGKTMAFLTPVMEIVSKAQFKARNGVGAVIITPTRELALQIYQHLREIAQYHRQSHGIIMGGANRRTEADKLAKGVNILVATPGRLLDHLQNTKSFVYSNLQCLVIDEADRILEIGFEEEMHQIINILPKERQTMLFSATQTKNVEDLARLAIRNKPIYVGVDDDSAVATVNSLEQGYVVCPSEKRFLLLYTFLKKNLKKKVMVFFSSCNSVKFHAELLNYVDIPVMDIHGKQKQAKRTSTFFEFCNAKSGILLCTDVAARGLDIPYVDWIVQYDPPDEPKEYIHRVGRTARGSSGGGRALLFLAPNELGFIKYLRAAKVTLNEYEFPDHKIANVQNQLEKLVEKNYFLNKSAKEGYRSFLLSYASHSLKHIFNVHELDLAAVGKSFGFSVPPRINLNLKTTGQKVRRRGGGGGFGDDSKRPHYFKKKASGHAFSASNPYGKRKEGDKRQFAKF